MQGISTGASSPRALLQTQHLTPNMSKNKTEAQTEQQNKSVTESPKETNEVGIRPCLF